MNGVVYFSWGFFFFAFVLVTFPNALHTFWLHKKKNIQSTKQTANAQQHTKWKPVRIVAKIFIWKFNKEKYLSFVIADVHFTISLVQMQFNAFSSEVKKKRSPSAINFDVAFASKVFNFVCTLLSDWVKLSICQNFFFRSEVSTHFFSFFIIIDDEKLLTCTYTAFHHSWLNDCSGKYNVKRW